MGFSRPLVCDFVLGVLKMRLSSRVFFCWPSMCYVLLLRSGFFMFFLQVWGLSLFRPSSMMVQIVAALSLYCCGVAEIFAVSPTVLFSWLSYAAGDVLMCLCSFVPVLGPGCSVFGGCRCGDFPPRLILLRRAPGSFVVIWIVVVVFVLAGGCGGRRWACSIVCSFCVFLVCVQQRLGRVADLILFCSG
ncbi:hypothetical protein MtrunA17_Chr8g0388111 [Medicago truncatula]|uniref:Transmembrane protein n=1 Tax=Medicago truncatula TaxID=3880 RepID=A0A396GTG1_MEDTR|nr:hypothetical protein MtrunA17_Chr8g0388111 [Medicago truncatula]